MSDIGLETAFKLSVLVNMVDNLTRPAQIAYQGMDDTIKKTENLLGSTDGSKGFLTGVKNGAVEAGERITQNVDESIRKTESLLKSGDFRSGLFSNVKSGAVEAAEAVDKDVGGSIKKTENLLRNTNGKEGLLNNIKEGADEAGQSWGVLGEKIANAGKVVGVGMLAAGATFAGFATKGVEMNEELTKALNGVQSSTGYTNEAMQGMKENMIEIYNTGGSFEEIGAAMGSIAQQGTLGNEELKRVTKNALLLKDTFDFEVSESFRSSDMLMRQFGVTSDQAYNLLAQGAQRGLDKNGNLLDSVNEYSVHFKQMGFSSEEMFNMFSNGAAAGVFDVDKLGDAVKEFGIRSKDGSKGTMEAFQALGLNAETLSADFAKGGETGKTAFKVVNDALKNCSDPLIQNQVGTALWGTMWEDMGSKAVFALSETNGEISLTNNALGDISKIKYNTFGEAMDGIKRQLSTAILLPLGQEVLPMLNQFANYLQQNMPAMIGVAKTALNELQYGFKLAKESVGFLIDNFNIIGPILVGVVTGIASFKIISEIKALMDAWKASTIIATIAQQGLNAAIMANPIAAAAIAIGIIIGLAVLVYKNWEPISKFFLTLWEGTKNVFNNFWNWLKGFMSKWGVEILAVVLPFVGVPLLIIKHWDSIKAGLNSVWQWIKTTAISVFTSIATFLNSIWNTIKSVAMAALQPLVNGVTNIFNNMKNGIANILNGLKLIVSGVWNAIKTTTLGLVLLLIDLVTGNFTKLKIDAVKIFNTLKTSFVQIWTGIKQVFIGSVQAIVGLVVGAFQNAKNNIMMVWNFVKSFLVALWNGLASMCKSAWDNMANGVSNTLTLIKNFVVNTWNGIMNFFSTLPGRLLQYGVSMMTSLRDGISSTMSSIASALSSGLDGAVSFIKDLPSKFIEWGADMIHGLASGITNTIGEVVNAVTGVGEKIRSFLHFSVPDEGPLTDYETWMPDFLSGMANGIKVNASLVFDKVQDVATGIKDRISPHASLALAGGMNIPVEVSQHNEKSREINQDLEDRRRYKKFDIREILKEKSYEKEKEIIKKNGKKVIIQKLELHVQHIKNMDDFQKQLEDATNSYSEDDE